MITVDQLPEKSVDAARLAMAIALANDGDGIPECIAAALNAWEGMHTHEWQRPWLGGMSGTDLILPLPTEASDA